MLYFSLGEKQSDSISSFDISPNKSSANRNKLVALIRSEGFELDIKNGLKLLSVIGPGLAESICVEVYLVNLG